MKNSLNSVARRRDPKPNLEPSEPPLREPAWSHLLPEAQWQVIKRASDALRARNIPILLGGALALAHYTGRLRDTHDGDFFILAADRESAVETLKEVGFRDYFDELPYDRGWIFRATREGSIVDLIWTTPNRLCLVTAEWFRHSRLALLRGEVFRTVPIEELFWIKLFVMQRSRCDWPDLLNLLRTSGAEMNWDRLLHLAQNQMGLLHSIMLLFSWASPEAAAALPSRIRKQFKLPDLSLPEPALAERERVALLDSRPWFAAFQPASELMKV